MAIPGACAILQCMSSQGATRTRQADSRAEEAAERERAKRVSSFVRQAAAVANRHTPIVHGMPQRHLIHHHRGADGPDVPGAAERAARAARTTLERALDGLRHPHKH